MSQDRERPAWQDPWLLAAIDTGVLMVGSVALPIGVWLVGV